MRINIPISWSALVFVVALQAASSITRAGTDDALTRELQRDVVLRALVDEQERNRTGLSMPDLPSPYFIEYGLTDARSFQVVAELGAVTARNDARNRRMRADVRVGSYELDNTNFRGAGFGGFGGGFGDASLPTDDDYNALRQRVWWASDRRYKEVVESYAEKKAFMESRVIDDKANDFSREEPTIHFDGPIPLQVESELLEQLAIRLSAVFREFLDLKESSVTLVGVAGQKYLVNTEGTRLRTSLRRYSISAVAKVQADDGMELSSAVQLEVRRYEKLPTLEELSKQVREMANQLLAVRKAPLLEAYSGPVLFEAEAAAGLFLRLFGNRFAGGQRPVGSRANPDDFANKLNKRILPRFVQVVDDPTLEVLEGATIMGHYDFDDQAVRARSVRLVENGRLLSLLMSRNPSKEFSRSTGHGRGLFAPRAMAGCMVVSGSQPLAPSALRQELNESCQDEGLEFGIRIAAMGTVGTGRGGPEGGGGAPLLIYKVFSDGREELVRGAELARVDMKAFKRILALGDTPHVLNVVSVAAQTVAAPAMLFEELDLAKIDRDFERPPILPPPLARAQ